MNKLTARLKHLITRLLTPITPGAKRAVVTLFVLSLMLNGANLLWTAHEVHSATAAQHAQAAAQQRAQAAAQAAAQRAGEAVERKLCTSLEKLAALKPPQGSATANPSRAYEQAQHATLAELGPDIGCK